MSESKPRVEDVDDEMLRQSTWSSLEVAILNITEWLAEYYDIHVADDTVIRNALIAYGMAENKRLRIGVNVAAALLDEPHITGAKHCLRNIQNGKTVDYNGQVLGASDDQHHP